MQVTYRLFQTLLLLIRVVLLKVENIPDEQQQKDISTVDEVNSFCAHDIVGEIDTNMDDRDKFDDDFHGEFGSYAYQC